MSSSSSSSSSPSVSFACDVDGHPPYASSSSSLSGTRSTPTPAVAAASSTRRWAITQKHDTPTHRHMHSLNRMTPASSSSYSVLTSSPSSNSLFQFHQHMQFQNEARQRREEAEREKEIQYQQQYQHHQHHHQHHHVAHTHGVSALGCVSCAAAASRSHYQAAESSHAMQHTTNGESEPTPIASASASSSSHPPASSTAPLSSSSPLSRTMEYARSLTRLRSSLLSAYACYCWAAEQLRGESHAMSAATVAEDASGLLASSASLVHRGMSGSPVAAAARLGTKGSTTALHTLSQRLTPSRDNVVFIKRMMRMALHMWSFYSRRFHRFLRPHLLLLMRSRALGKVIGIIAPTLRRNALLFGHTVFVWGSAWMFIRRVQVGGPTQSVWAPITGTLAAIRQRWTNLGRTWKATGCMATIVGAFILYTCISIMREHAALRQRRLAELGLTQPPSTNIAGAPAVGSNDTTPFDLDPHALAAHLDRSPDPTPDSSPLHSPALTPAASAIDLQQLGYEPDDASHAGTSDEFTYHAPSSSFHRDCSACIAAALASSAVASYTHHHPPNRYQPTAHESIGYGYDAESQSTGYPLPVDMAHADLHPLASAIARRMEWSPARRTSAPATMAHVQAAIGLPDTPVHAMPPHSLSFISPASLRLTNIRISKLKQQTDSIERLRQQLQENMRLVYEQDRPRDIIATDTDNSMPSGVAGVAADADRVWPAVGARSHSEPHCPDDADGPFTDSDSIRHPANGAPSEPHQPARTALPSSTPLPPPTFPSNATNAAPAAPIPSGADPPLATAVAPAAAGAGAGAASAPLIPSPRRMMELLPSIKGLFRA